MCGRFEQSGTRKYYARYLDPRVPSLKWVGADPTPQYNVSPGQLLLALHMLSGKLDSDHIIWGYRTPQEAAEKKKPWINSRIEKALTGRYFRHMFREGRVIIPAGGWFEWTVENSKKQPWYIRRKAEELIFMAGVTNFKPFTQQPVEVGLVIVTEDCGGGMVDIHDRKPVVLGPEDALRWMDPETEVEEAAHIAQSRSVPTEEFMWWRVSPRVNRVDPNNNSKELLVPITPTA